MVSVGPDLPPPFLSHTVKFQIQPGPVDYELAHGVYPDMAQRGWDRDDWPTLNENVALNG